MTAPKRKHTRPTTPAPGHSQRNAPRELVIDDESINDPAVRDLVFGPVVDGQLKGHGLVPRKHSQYPAEMFDPPRDLVLIPRGEMAERARQQETAGSRISDLLPWPSLDQNGQGYCWCYSTGGCVMAIRTINNQPYVRLNPHSLAAVIKRGKDEGGWCGLSAKGAREIGYAPESVWPGHQYRNWQSLYNDACKKAMALHRVTEDWVDLTRDVYDQNLTMDQLYTCLLSRVPCATDYNWWSHSVMACDCVAVESGSLGTRIRNSWGEGWGDKNKHGVGGFSVLRGSKAQVNGAVAIRVTGASAA